MEEIIKKWKPILKELKISEKNYVFFSTYAETLINNLSDIENEQNLLPVNLRVLSQLDFDNIDIKLSNLEDLEKIEDLEIKETIDRSILLNIDAASGLKIVQDTESILLDKLITLLNTKKEIFIYKLVNSIGIRNIDENTTEMFITSRIKTN